MLNGQRVSVGPVEGKAFSLVHILPKERLPVEVASFAFFVPFVKEVLLSQCPPLTS